MKKIIGLVLVFILVFTVAAGAFAGSRPKITKQPESATVKKGGKVSFSIKTSGTVSSITWYFVDPETGSSYTGKKLAGAVKGVKIDGQTNGRKITLKNVPETMHGWKVYAHVNGNGYTVNSDEALLLIAGMDSAASSETEKPAAPTETEKPAASTTESGTPVLNSVEFSKKTAALKEKVEFTAVTSINAVKLTMYVGKKEIKSWTTGYTDTENTRIWKASYAFSGAGDRTLGFKAFSADGLASETKSAKITVTKDTAETAAQPESNNAVSESSAEIPASGPFTVSSTSKVLRMMDASGNIIDSEPTDKLQFDSIGYVLVTSDDPIVSWTLNGIRVEPEHTVKEFRITNITSDLLIDVKTRRPTSADAVVDESRMCKVVCKGCTFTYSRGKLRSVSEGEVPAGAPINVFADSSDLAKGGYSINGGEPENAGKAGFQFIVNEDVEIVCQ